MIKETPFREAIRRSAIRGRYCSRESTKHITDEIAKAYPAEDHARELLEALDSVAYRLAILHSMGLCTGKNCKYCLATKQADCALASAKGKSQQPV